MPKKLLLLIVPALVIGCSHMKPTENNEVRSPAGLPDKIYGCVEKDGFQKTNLEIRGHMAEMNGFTFRSSGINKDKNGSYKMYEELYHPFALYIYEQERGARSNFLVGIENGSSGRRKSYTCNP